MKYILILTTSILASLSSVAVANDFFSMVGRYTYSDYTHPVGSYAKQLDLSQRDLIYSQEVCPNHQPKCDNPDYVYIKVGKVLNVDYVFIEQDQPSSHLQGQIQYCEIDGSISCLGDFCVDQQGALIGTEYWPQDNHGHFYPRIDDVFRVDGNGLTDTERLYKEHSEQIIYQHTDKLQKVGPAQTPSYSGGSITCKPKTF